MMVEAFGFGKSGRKDFWLGGSGLFRCGEYDNEGICVMDIWLEAFVWGIFGVIGCKSCFWDICLRGFISSCMK